MDRSKIPMLSRFDAISHIMPYYGQTHRAFLLLSSLCSKTRNKLDEFYNEFVICMKEYWVLVEEKWFFQKDHMFLPNDLFEVAFDITKNKMIDKFIRFIRNLRDFKGWYFNSHFMHSKIKIRDPIILKFADAKKIYDLVDVLKSTQIILCKEDIQSSKVHYESSTLDTSWK